MDYKLSFNLNHFEKAKQKWYYAKDGNKFEI
jgi:hypothetical protein